jgi:hypothetical protein
MPSCRCRGRSGCCWLSCNCQPRNASCVLGHWASDCFSLRRDATYSTTGGHLRARRETPAPRTHPEMESRKHSNISRGALCFQDRTFRQSAFIKGRVGVYKQNLYQDRPYEIQYGERVWHKAGLYGARYKGQVQCTQPEQRRWAHWLPLAKDRRHLRTKTRSRDNKHLPSRLREL